MCNKEMSLESGYWIINGLGELLCHGTNGCSVKKQSSDRGSEGSSEGLLRSPDT